MIFGITKSTQYFKDTAKKYIRDKHNTKARQALSNSLFFNRRGKNKKGPGLLGGPPVGRSGILGPTIYFLSPNEITFTLSQSHTDTASLVL